MKKYFIKSLLSIVLILASYFCFTFPTKNIIQNEIQYSECSKKITTVEKDGLKRFLEYIGLFLLVVSAWQWRNDLGFDSLGFISKQPSIKPTDPNKRKITDGDIPPANFIIKSQKEKLIKPTQGVDILRENKLAQILKFISNNPNSISNLELLRKNLNIYRTTLQSYLYTLMERNLIRRDTYPGHLSVFSLTNSADNLAIDYFKKHHLKSEEIISDYRYLKIKNTLEVDSVIKTNKANYIIEIKYINNKGTNILRKGIQQLLRIEEDFYLEPLILILLVVGKKLNLSKSKLGNYLVKENLKIIFLDTEKLTVPNNDSNCLYQ